MMDAQQLIDRYLRGEATEAEQIEFQQRLDADIEFETMYRATKEIVDGLRVNALHEKRDFLKSLDLEAKKETPVIKMEPRSRYGWLSIAAAIVVLVGVATFLIRQQSTPTLTGPELYAANFTIASHDFKDAARGDTQRQDCYTSYDAQLWSAAIPCIEALIADEGIELDYFYLGVSLLGNDQPTEAITAFNQITEIQATLTSDALSWYQALAALGISDIAQAKAYLERIQSAPYKTKADALISELP